MSPKMNGIMNVPSNNHLAVLNGFVNLFFFTMKTPAIDPISTPELAPNEPQDSYPAVWKIESRNGQQP